MRNFEHTGRPDALKRCTRCVLPETYPGISFDENGVCNHCRRYDAANDKPLGEEALLKVVEKYRSRDTKYEALSALSGGRDSTYALYYAVRRLGLKTLAFTIDNGFIPEETWQNIDNTTRILGVDHVIVRHDFLKKSIRAVLSAWIKKPSPAMVTFLCLGCRLGMKKAFVDIARTYQLPLCISGGGEPEESFATAFFTGSSSRFKRSLAMASGIGKEFLRNPRYLLSGWVPSLMFMEFLYYYPPIESVRRRVCPKWHYLGLFDYLEYDEEHILDVITNELKWKKYHYSAASWRADCKVNLLKNACYQRILAFTKNDELVSGMIRQGQLTREKALVRLGRDNDIPVEFLAEFFAEVGLRHEGCQDN
jgi:hypothetical protein